MKHYGIRMARPGKSTRPYRSDRRREQAEQTRARILAAARRLFTERGFAGTTVGAIAAEAGTAQETVYATFQSKTKLLAALVRVAVRGGEDEEVIEEAGPVAIAAATDQREQLRMFAADVVRRLERVAPLIAVLRSAPSEPALAELLAGIHEARAVNMGRLVRALEANGPLRVDTDQAADTVWALASPELFHLLTQTRDWTSAQYGQWLADSLGAALLEQR